DKWLWAARFLKTRTLASDSIDAGRIHLNEARAKPSREVRIGAPPAILHQSIAKGSIAVDGISLTIVDLTERDFSLWIIPETWQRTTLSQRRPGDAVNLESDLVGKYVFRFMETQGKLFRA
ncbi:MAG TPA: S4 domain-containing protein, partial [Candidatus Sumerlaeota bacterium]|nr:S4 domain-containing protein [Candidatus Sumerlaeota bacterium]